MNQYSEQMQVFRGQKPPYNKWWYEYAQRTLCDLDREEREAERMLTEKYVSTSGKNKLRTALKRMGKLREMAQAVVDSYEAEEAKAAQKALLETPLEDYRAELKRREEWLMKRVARFDVEHIAAALRAIQVGEDEPKLDGEAMLAFLLIEDLALMRYALDWIEAHGQ